jgi:hypothetical protein
MNYGSHKELWDGPFNGKRLKERPAGNDFAAHGRVPPVHDGPGGWVKVPGVAYPGDPVVGLQPDRRPPRHRAGRRHIRRRCWWCGHLAYCLLTYPILIWRRGGGPASTRGAPAGPLGPHRWGRSAGSSICTARCQRCGCLVWRWRNHRIGACVIHSELNHRGRIEFGFA